MEDIADFDDWELVHGSDLTDNHMGVVVLDEETVNGAIKDDYFAFDPDRCKNLQSEEESDEGGIDSDNPSCVEPDSDSNTFLETSRKKLGFVAFPIRNYGGFLSDESSDGQKSLANSEHVELGSLEDSVMEMGFEESDPGFGNLGWESEGGDISDSREMTEIGGDASITKGEKREKIWWKVPLGLLKYCLVGMRPVWSVSIAAAVVGIVMLWKKLYRIKHKSRSIPLTLAFDDKSRLYSKSCGGWWYFDSGCSRHMMGDCSLFTTLKPKDGGSVSLDDNTKKKIIGVGSIGLGSTSIEEVLLVKEGFPVCGSFFLSE